jgi:HK97 family phage prohead protease
MENLEIKASITVDDVGAITGIAWPFGAGPDGVGDIITKGAFSLAVTDLPMLLAHDPEQPIGLWDEVKETSEGLQVKGHLFINESKRAKSVRGLIQGGLITGLSIGFKTKASTKQGANRVISALDLHEISVVRNPAHPRARISSAKSATASIVEAINRAAVALRKKD